MDIFQNQEERALAWWEDNHIMPRDRSALSVPEVRAVVAHVWSMVGLRRPPAVVNIRPGEAGYVPEALAWCSHDCLTIAFQTAKPKTLYVLHELSHAILEDPVDVLELRKPVERAMHGPLWLGNYVWLMGRLMGPLFNPFHVRGTLPPEVRGWSIPWHPTVRGRARPDLV